jgi:hypothetical protein
MPVAGRSMSAQMIGEITGYSRRTVANWCEDGIAGTTCPHSRIEVKTNRSGFEYRFDLAEVDAWMTSVGLRRKETPAAIAGTPSVFSSASASATDARGPIPEAQPADDIPLDANGQIDVYVMLERLRRAIAVQVSGLARGGSGVTPAAAQAAAGAINNLDKVVRQQLAAMEDLERARADRMDREEATRMLSAIAALVRQTFSGGGGASLANDIASSVRQTLITEGVIDPAAAVVIAVGDDGIERLIAARVIDVIESSLTACTEAVERTLGEIGADTARTKTEAGGPPSPAPPSPAPPSPAPPNQAREAA